MICKFPGSATRIAMKTPERRRVVVIGAGAAGLTAALHLGEHSLLLEQRSQVCAVVNLDLAGREVQWGSHDRASSFPLGFERAGAVGPEDHGADRDRQGVRAWERQGLIGAAEVGSRRKSGAAGSGEPVVVARWIAPRLSATPAALDDRESLQSLVTLLRGELKLSTRVCRIDPLQHLVALADGGAIVYDKLVSSVRSDELSMLLHGALPNRIHSHQATMRWLAARDVELLDDDSQFLQGDAGPFAAGRRVAEVVKRALALRFRPASDMFVRGERLFKPRLVAMPDPVALC